MWHRHSCLCTRPEQQKLNLGIFSVSSVLNLLLTPTPRPPLRSLCSRSATSVVNSSLRFSFATCPDFSESQPATCEFELFNF